MLKCTIISYRNILKNKSSLKLRFKKIILKILNLNFIFLSQVILISNVFFVFFPRDLIWFDLKKKKKKFVFYCHNT